MIYLQFEYCGLTPFENWGNPRVTRYSHNMLLLHREWFSVIGKIKQERKEKQTNEL